MKSNENENFERGENENIGAKSRQGKQWIQGKQRQLGYDDKQGNLNDIQKTAIIRKGNREITENGGKGKTFISFLIFIIGQVTHLMQELHVLVYIQEKSGSFNVIHSPV